MASRRSQRLLAGVLMCVLVGFAWPGVVAAAGGWNLKIGGHTATAQFLSDLARPDVEIALTNSTGVQSLEPNVGALLDLLGLRGSYSQEVTWSGGSGPDIGCPSPGVTVACSVSNGHGTALIPSGIRAILIAQSQAGSTALKIAPGPVSLRWDAAVAAVGITLSVLVGGPVAANADMVIQLVAELLPEAAGAADAIARHDGPAAIHELTALEERAAAIIADHLADWTVKAGLHFVLDAAGVGLAIDLAIAATKAIPVLASAWASASGTASTVTVGFGGGTASAGPATSGTGPSSGGGQLDADTASVTYASDFVGWTGAPGWQPLGGMLVSDGGSSVAIAPYEPPGPDYSVEAEIQVVRVMEAGSIVGRANEGVLVRGAPDGGYFVAGYCSSALVISPCADNPPVFGIYYVGGSPLGSSPAPKFDSGWHTYRVDVRGDALTLSIDGSVVATAVDNRSLLGTQVGLEAAGIQVNVRSFTVLSP